MTDDYVCSSCGKPFYGSTNMVTCDSCGRVFCSYECSEADYSSGKSECKFCLGTDATQEQLLEAACNAINMSVAEFKTFFLDSK